jgi:hypothetical protein
LLKSAYCYHSFIFGRIPLKCALLLLLAHDTGNKSPPRRSYRSRKLERTTLHHAKNETDSRVPATSTKQGTQVFFDRSIFTIHGTFGKNPTTDFRIVQPQRKLR